MIIVVLLLWTSASFANVHVSVTVEPKRGTANDVYSLSVEVTGGTSSVTEAPSFEPSSDFTIESVGTSSSHTFVNGEFTQAMTFSFNVYPRNDLSPGEYLLPKGSIYINAQQVQLKQQSLTIEKEHSRQSNQSTLGIDFSQTVSKVNPYMGEQILYKVNIVTGADKLFDATLSDPEFPGFWHEPLGKPKELVRSIGNQVLRIYVANEALFPTEAGELQIPARQLSGQIRVPKPRQQQRRRSWFDDPWSDFDSMLPPGISLGSGYNIMSKRLSANSVALQVRPLPPAPREIKGYILVGKVSAKSQLDNQQIKQGEGVTLTITVSGNANLRPFELDLSEIERSPHFRVYSDKPELTTKLLDDEIIYTKTLKLALVANKAGQLQIPSIIIPTFDPKDETYVFLQTESYELTVTPDPSAGTQLDTSAKRSTVADKDRLIQAEANPVVERDLLPQKPGSVITPQFSASRSVVIFIIIVSPLVSLFLIYLLRHRKQFVLNPAKLRAARAGGEAINALNHVSGEIGGFEKLLTIFRTYLGDRFGREGSSLTSADVDKLLRKYSDNSKLIESARQLFEKLEKLKFGAAVIPSGNENVTQLRDTIVGIIQLLEKEKAKK